MTREAAAELLLSMWKNGNSPLQIIDAIYASAAQTRPELKAYVVMQNDYPAAVFNSMAGAETFVERQPTKTVSRCPIHWHIHELALEDK